MTWQGIEGHDRVVQYFRRALERGRLANSFLFTGPEGIGKRSFALKLAQSLLCQARPEKMLDACGHCPACLQAAAGSHPDLETVAKPPDKSFLPLELLIGDKEHRMREGLCYWLSLRPLLGGRKIAVIDDADYLNAEGANSLLKTLEEPPPGSLLILIGTSPARQLPTIRSRCQMVRFHPLSDAIIARLALQKGIVADPEQAERLAVGSQGSLTRAGELADEALRDFRGRLYPLLASGIDDFAGSARSVLGFVEEAGTAAPARRERLRQVVGLAVEFYRGCLLARSGQSLPGDAELARWVQQALSRRAAGPGREETCLEHCLAAAAQIDRNANQATLVENWLDLLAGEE